MPLVAATLAVGLAKIFRDQPVSGADAANKVAKEYDTYCKTALAPPGAPIFTGMEKNTFEGLIAAALATADTGSAAMVAMAFANAVQAYWLAPPVQFSGGPVMGMVTAVPGAQSIVGPLSSALSNTQNTEDTIGQVIATQLDVATKTVLVTFTAPPPPAGPPPPAMVL